MDEYARIIEQCRLAEYPVLSMLNNLCIGYTIEEKTGGPTITVGLNDLSWFVNEKLSLDSEYDDTSEMPNNVIDCQSGFSYES